MIDGPDYRFAKNTAYEILQNVYPFKLEIDILQIIDYYPDIKLHTYSELCSTFNIEYYNLLDSLTSNHGFTVKNQITNKSEIFYNDYKDWEICKFTLAHKLGHYILGHLVDDDIARKEADCFARNLLCPAPIVKELSLRTVDDYTSIFNVSEPMASVSIAYAASDLYYIEAQNYSIIADMTYAYMSGYDSLDTLYGAVSF